MGCPGSHQGKMFKIILGLSNILNIIKENNGIHRGSSCGGRSRGQQFAAVATLTIALAANSGKGGGRPTLVVAEAARGQTTINQHIKQYQRTRRWRQRRRQLWQWWWWRRQQWRGQRGSHGSGDSGANSGRGDHRCGWRSSFSLFLHNSTYRCDNNCHVFCLAKHLSVSDLLGLFVEFTFRRTLILSKMR